MFLPSLQASASALPRCASRADLQGVDPLPLSVYRQRLQRLQELMAVHGFTVLICEPATNFSYLLGANFGRSERLIALVIPEDSEPVVVCPDFEVERVESSVHGLASVRGWLEHEDPYRLVYDLLGSMRPSRVGIEPTTRFGTVVRLRDVLKDGEFDDAGDLFAQLRIIKSKEEVALIRRAVSITERSIAATFAGLEAGMSERDVGALLSGEMRQRGARGGGLVQFGPGSALPHGGPSDRRLDYGMPVLIDAGCRVYDYTSDITRMHFFGDAPSPKYQEVFNTVLAAQTAAAEAGQHGMECQELDHIARTVIAQAGYGDYFTHRLGHGMGMEGHEPPYLVRGNDRELEPGMVFTIEPGIYLPGEWGVRIEDDFLVTDDGLEALSSTVSQI